MARDFKNLKFGVNIHTGIRPGVDPLAEALHAVSLTDTPRGPVKFDHFGNVVGDVFIRKCERKGSQLVNTIVKTYPNVSQFWTYDETAFLANPVYARDYPPAKNLE